MTITSLLGRGVTPAVPVSRYEMSGPSAMGDPEVLHYIERGAFSHGHGGGGKGGKGNQSAMSALTLLAFLFFINLLQTCLKENMMPTGTAMLMMMPSNRSAPLSRSSREIHEQQTNDIDALPGPGVHWDTNVLIRQKGDPGSSEQISDHSARLVDEDEQKTNNEIYNDSDNFIWDEDVTVATSVEVKQNDSLLSKEALKLNKSVRENSLTENTDAFLHRQLKTDDKELYEQVESPISETYLWEHKGLTTAGDLENNEYYQNTGGHATGEGVDWDYYHDDESYPETDVSVMRDFSTAEPGSDGFVNDRYELEEADYPSSFGEHAWRIVTSVSDPIVQRIQTSFSVSQCYELVVCEAHRVGRAWGTSGLLLASGFSEIVMWFYGEDAEHRKLITEAAATGRERQSCRVQMQQCEDMSRDRSVLPIMATVLEQFV